MENIIFSLESIMILSWYIIYHWYFRANPAAEFVHAYRHGRSYPSGLDSRLFAGNRESFLLSVTWTLRLCGWRSSLGSRFARFRVRLAANAVSESPACRMHQSVLFQTIQEPQLLPTKCAEARAFSGTNAHFMHVPNVVYKPHDAQ